MVPDMAPGKWTWTGNDEEGYQATISDQVRAFVRMKGATLASGWKWTLYDDTEDAVDPMITGEAEALGGALMRAEKAGVEYIATAASRRHRERLRMVGLPDAFRERYHVEPQLHAAVDMIRSLLEGGMLTTDDVARAAVLAAQMYAETNCAPIRIVLREDDRA